MELADNNPTGLVFDDEYYKEVIDRYGYNAFDFKPIDFDISHLDKGALNQRWLCHYDGEPFSQAVKNNEKTIITTGVGLSGAPHMGTISQMMRAVFLQEQGFKVQFVLGDLDSYNARSQEYSVVRARSEQYREFLAGLGFSDKLGVLRTQDDHPEVCRTAYLISRCLSDEDFLNAEEDLSELYQKQGAYPGIKYPVKQAINLMVADFIHLGCVEKNKSVMVMLGLEEHLYVRIAKDVIKRMKMPFHLGAMYSKIIKGFNGFPKMSKSIPGSSINVSMNVDQIRHKLQYEEGAYSKPEESVAYQMMCAVSNYSPRDLNILREKCAVGGRYWAKAKDEYAEYLGDIFAKWPKDKTLDKPRTLTPLDMFKHNKGKGIL